MKLLFLVTTSCFLVLQKFVSTVAVCGYEQIYCIHYGKGCPRTKAGYLNVHLVPHSHMDMGWVETVDQYYGADDTQSMISVKQIFESVVEELPKNEHRRFICAETGFFQRWWKEQNDTTQSIVMDLVNSGQFEFIHGGWVMNDEAGSHYSAIVDQMTLGLRFLNTTFGPCGVPRVAWQIDPFGHSREQASLFAQMGYDGLFFGRLDYQDKEKRVKDQEMEMIWSGSPTNLGQSSWIFTGALYNSYDPPDEFCYDHFCRRLNDVDDWDAEAKKFIKVAKNWSKVYRTNHLMMAMGADFHYMYAEEWYKNLDKLIKHTNRLSPELNLIYSTPACYLQEIHKSNISLPLKADDFFPYASSSHAVWTGYFTSRPTLKYYIQKANNILQVCKQLGAEFQFRESTHIEKVLKRIEILAEAVSVMQHHDAVSGTSRQHVANDYAKRINIGVKSCDTVIGDVFRISLQTVKDANYDKDVFKHEFCHLLNISSCSVTESSDDILISVYNPLARIVANSYIRVPVQTSQWTVTGSKGSIPSQTLPIAKPVQHIPGRTSAAIYEVVFPAGNLPGLTVSRYRLSKKNEIARNRNKTLVDKKFIKTEEEFTIENSVGLGATFDSETGLLKSIYRGSVHQNITQNFYYYEAVDKLKGFSFQYSGAYVFRPTKQNPRLIAQSSSDVHYKVFKGKHVTEIHQTFSNWVSQVVRLYDTSDALEFEWLVGPIPIQDEIGKEIVVRYSSDIPTNIFFTDSNGREMQKRKKDYRPSWNYKVHEKVAGNFYPVNSRMIISENENLTSNGKSLILLNDRTQGGTSMNDGEMEIMIHRRLLMDDGFGVEESLNETAFFKGLVARGKHFLVLAGGDTGIPTSIHRTMAQEIYMEKVIGFTPLNRNDNVVMTPYETVFHGLTRVLPSNIHLLTLEPQSKDILLIRLEHFYEVDEHPDYSQTVTIDINELKGALPFIRSIKETTLSANQWKRNSQRFSWLQHLKDESYSEKSNYRTFNESSEILGDNYIIMRPMEIRTYLIYVY